MTVSLEENWKCFFHIIDRALFFVKKKCKKLKKKKIFSPQFKILNKIFVASENLSEGFFFQFYFPHCLSHKILFLSNWKPFSGKKKDEKNATENYFSEKKKRKNDFFFEKIQ